MYTVMHVGGRSAPASIPLCQDAVLFALELSEVVVGEVEVVDSRGKIAGFVRGYRSYPVTAAMMKNLRVNVKGAVA